MIFIKIIGPSLPPLLMKKERNKILTLFVNKVKEERTHKQAIYFYHVLSSLTLLFVCFSRKKKIFSKQAKKKFLNLKNEKI